MIIPLVFRPKYLSARNRWIQNMSSATSIVRESVLVAISFGMMYALYYGGIVSLEKIRAWASVAYFHPTLPLGLILLMLFCMLLFSTTVTALGSLYLAHDLDLVLASPISQLKFFFGKLWEVVLSSTWMGWVFVVPTVCAFGYSYNAGISYYFLALIILVPYFVLPATLALLAVTLLARLIPANRTRGLLIFASLAALFILYWFVKLIFPQGTSFQNYTDLLRMVSILSMPNTTWSPSYWTAVPLGELLEPSDKIIFHYILMLYSCCILTGCMAFISLKLLHAQAYSKARSLTHGLTLHSKRAQERLIRITPLMDSQFRAIIGKEFRVFARDMGQAVQLLLLLALCMIYLYNFRVLRTVGGLSERTETWWEGFLVVTNVCMGAFVITAVGTRFVFTSVSMEGQSFWILQKAPITIAKVLRAKFWCWLVPIASISSVILASGALAIDAQPNVVMINALSSWVICYGIVGLAVGLGAFFANFNWEHSSQLAASFGSLVYMLFASLLIAINMVPTTLLVFLRTLRILNYSFSDLQWYGCIATTAALLIYINYAATRWALKVGENALLERLNKS